MTTTPDPTPLDPMAPHPYDVDPRNITQVARVRAAARRGDARAAATVRKLDHDRKAKRDADRAARQTQRRGDVDGAKADYLSHAAERRRSPRT